MTGTKIRTVIVDDHRMVREGLRAMLAGNPVIEIVGEAEDLSSALRAIEDTDPEIVLLDVRLATTSGLDVCRRITAGHPEVAVVFLTVYEDEQYVFEALRAGARGYILKRVGDEDLVRFLEQVRDGHTIIDPALTGQIALRAAKIRPGQSWPGVEHGLTQREAEVLQTIVDGLNNRQIAERLYISEETVKTHVRKVFRKLGVSDRAQAVSFALREGLVK